MSQPPVAEGWNADDHASDEERDRIERNASFAFVLAMMAHLGALVVCCSSGLSGIFSVGMAVGAIWVAKGVLESGVEGAPRAYAMASLPIAVIALMWSATITLFYCAYIGLYAMILGSAAIGGNF